MSRKHMRKYLLARSTPPPSPLMSDLPGFHYDPVKKRYFKVDQDYKPTTDAPPAPPPKIDPIPALMSLRQHGLLRHSFEATATLSKVSGITEKSTCKVAFYDRSRFAAYQCDALLTDQGIDFVASLWSLRQAATTFSFARFLALKNEATHSAVAPYSLDASINANSVFSNVADACLYDSATDRYNLLVAVTADMYYISQAYFINSLKTQHCLGLGHDALYCCAFNPNSQRAAFGTEKCGLCYKCDTLRHESNIYSQRISVFCTAFDTTGQLVFSGSRRGELYCNDLRDNPSSKMAYKMWGTPGALRSIRVLRDDRRVVCSGDSDQLLCVDVRMKQHLLAYDGHVNDTFKIPISVNEELGVLCSPGKDGRTRLWDLNSGRLMKTIDAPTCFEPGTLTGAVFKGSWGPKMTLPAVVVGYKDKVSLHCANI